MKLEAVVDLVRVIDKKERKKIYKYIKPSPFGVTGSQKYPKLFTPRILASLAESFNIYTSFWVGRWDAKPLMTIGITGKIFKVISYS